MEQSIEVKDQRANILRVLEASILKAVKEGEKTNWKGKHLTYVDEINKIGLLSRWREKSKLFLSVDYRSATYNNALMLARKTLVDLRADRFTMNVSEFIRSFMDLSPLIKGKKFVKLTDKENGELRIVGKKDDVVVMATRKEKAVYIKPGVTGQDLIRIMDDRRELDSITI